MTEAERAEWVKTLKVDDTVCYRMSYGFNGTCIEIVTVKKITPTGAIRTSDNLLFNRNGRVNNGYRWVYLEPYTTEVKAEVHRSKLLRQAKNAIQDLNSNHLDFSKISNDLLFEIIELRDKVKGIFE